MESKLLPHNPKKYAVRLQKGENLFLALENFFHKNNIKFAKISGVGAVCDAVIGVFEDGQYFKEKYSQLLELVNLDGNVTLKENAIYVHIHSTLSYGSAKKQIVTVAGHLFEATVGVTAEIFVEAYPNVVIHRKFDPACQLNVWDLSEK